MQPAQTFDEIAQQGPHRRRPAGLATRGAPAGLGLEKADREAADMQAPAWWRGGALLDRRREARKSGRHMPHLPLRRIAATQPRHVRPALA
jgi:hypothetical protein